MGAEAGSLLPSMAPSSRSVKSRLCRDLSLATCPLNSCRAAAEGTDAIGEGSPTHQGQNAHRKAESPKRGEVPCRAGLAHVEPCLSDVGRDAERAEIARRDALSRRG